MSYTTYDFEESLKQTIAASDVARVIAAWGKGDGMGEDAGHFRWSEEGATEWSGGFLLALKDGRFAYVTGWCDYTGWGCQDGAEIYYFNEEPGISDARTAAQDFAASPDESEWDREPADLNRWLASGATDSDDVQVTRR